MRIKGIKENKSTLKRGAIGMTGPAQVALVETLRNETDLTEGKIQEIRERFARNLTNLTEGFYYE